MAESASIQTGQDEKPPQNLTLPYQPSEDLGGINYLDQIPSGTYVPYKRYFSPEKSDFNEGAQRAALQALRDAKDIIINIHRLPWGEAVITNGLVRNLLEILQRENSSARLHIFLQDPALTIFFQQFQEQGVQMHIAENKRDGQAINKFVDALPDNKVILTNDNIGRGDLGLKVYRDEKQITTTWISGLSGSYFAYPYDTYGAERYNFAASTIFGLKPAEHGLEPLIQLPHEPSEDVRKLYKQLEISESNKPILVGIIPEANEIVEPGPIIDLGDNPWRPRLTMEKHLTKDQWKTLITHVAQTMQQKYPDRNVVFCIYLNPNRNEGTPVSPLEGADLEIQQAIQMANPHARGSFLRIHSWEDFGQMLSMMDVSVANDTGPAHFAGAVEGGSDVVVAFTNFFNTREIDPQFYHLPTKSIWNSSSRMKGVDGNTTEYTGIRGVSETIDMELLTQTTLKSLESRLHDKVT